MGVKFQTTIPAKKSNLIRATYILSNKNLFPRLLVTSSAVSDIIFETQKVLGKCCSPSCEDRLPLQIFIAADHCEMMMTILSATIVMIIISFN